MREEVCSSGGAGRGDSFGGIFLWLEILDEASREGNLLIRGVMRVKERRTRDTPGRGSKVHTVLRVHVLTRWCWREKPANNS